MSHQLLQEKAKTKAPSMYKIYPHDLLSHNLHLHHLSLTTRAFSFSFAPVLPPFTLLPKLSSFLPSSYVFVLSPFLTFLLISFLVLPFLSFSWVSLSLTSFTFFFLLFPFNVFLLFPFNVFPLPLTPLTQLTFPPPPLLIFVFPLFLWRIPKRRSSLPPPISLHTNVHSLLTNNQ